jgi:hypothetical protein
VRYCPLSPSHAIHPCAYITDCSLVDIRHRQLARCHTSLTARLPPYAIHPCTYVTDRSLVDIWNSPCINVNPLPVTPYLSRHYLSRQWRCARVACRAAIHKSVPILPQLTHRAMCYRSALKCGMNQGSREGRFAQMYFQRTRQTFAGAALPAAGVARFCTTSPTKRTKGQNKQKDSAREGFHPCAPPIPPHVKSTCGGVAAKIPREVR